MDLNDLLDKQRQLWRGSHWHALDCPALSTGFATLDTHLPGGGWPRHSLSELICPNSGMGELRLLQPLLQQLGQSHDEGLTGWQLWLNPPYLPYAPALQHWQLPLERTLVATPRQRQDFVWALEQSLRSRSCAVVLAWPGFSIHSQHMRRLQLAASQGQSMGFLFYQATHAPDSSLAALRLALKPQASGLLVDIRKRRSGWPVSDVPISLPALHP